MTVFCYICKRRFSERILLLFDKSNKLIIVISPQDLVDCIAEVSARYTVVVWQASLAAICNKASADLENFAAVKSERYKKIESFGGQLRKDVITIKVKRLCR